jgi:hypothetical protein
MNSFVRKAGSNISSFNAETNLTTNNTKNVSWFINSDGKIQSSKIKG